METITLFTQKNRKGIIHLVVFALAISLIISVFSHFMYNLSKSYTALAAILYFYIHSRFLLPILIEKKALKMYLSLTLCCFIFLSATICWFVALHSSFVTFHEDFTPTHPVDFLDKASIISLLSGFFPTLIIVGFCSFIYYLLIHEIKSFSPYLEILFNQIILLGIFYFAFFTPQIGIKEILLISIALLVFYAHTFFITPFLIEEKKIVKYILSLIMLCLSYFALFFLIIVSLDGRLEFKTIFFLIPTLLVTLFLSFVYGYVRLKIKAKQKATDLKLEAKESELNLLKSQVNPHFLFNSLNTLYATALTEDAPKTGESIAKLASLIRYMQEDINKDFIPLGNEIKYLQDYITIQKLRCAVEPQIEARFENFENHSISPGLLIPFVENAFKYGIDPSKASKLEVSVYCDQNRVTFECVNSYDEDYKTYYKEKGFGIGIENAKQRLELVYPKNHIFEIVKENNIFSVKIVINTSKK